MAYLKSYLSYFSTKKCCEAVTAGSRAFTFHAAAIEGESLWMGLRSWLQCGLVFLSILDRFTRVCCGQRRWMSGHRSWTTSGLTEYPRLPGALCAIGQIVTCITECPWGSVFTCLQNISIPKCRENFSFG